MEVSLENLFVNIGASSVKENLIYISTRTTDREKGEGERSEQKTLKQKAQTKRATREHTFKRKKTRRASYSVLL